MRALFVFCLVAFIATSAFAQGRPANGEIKQYTLQPYKPLRIGNFILTQKPGEDMQTRIGGELGKFPPIIGLNHDLITAQVPNDPNIPLVVRQQAQIILNQIGAQRQASGTVGGPPNSMPGVVTLNVEYVGKFGPPLEFSSTAVNEKNEVIPLKELTDPSLVKYGDLTAQTNVPQNRSFSQFAHLNSPTFYRSGNEVIAIGGIEQKEKTKIWVCQIKYWFIIPPKASLSQK